MLAGGSFTLCLSEDIRDLDCCDNEAVTGTPHVVTDALTDIPFYQPKEFWESVTTLSFRQGVHSVSKLTTCIYVDDKDMGGPSIVQLGALMLGPKTKSKSGMREGLWTMRNDSTCALNML